MSKLCDIIRQIHHSFCSVVVVAAGASVRMGKDKLSMDLGGQSVLSVTLSSLRECSAVDEIVVVTRPERAEEIRLIREATGNDKISKIVFGGKTRTESAFAGVSAVSRKAKIICIHDGARPFVSERLVSDVVRQAVLHNAAAPALPVKETVKTAENGFVSGTLDRSKLYAVQTPQAFDASIIKSALTKAVKDGVTYTDDCAAVEAIGCPVYLSAGEEENLKITTPIDIALARVIQRRREGHADIS